MEDPISQTDLLKQQSVATSGLEPSCFERDGTC